MYGFAVDLTKSSFAYYGVLLEPVMQQLHRNHFADLGMHTLTHQIRLAALLLLCSAGAHLRADAQVRAFSFSERGRIFLTSPTVFAGSTSGGRADAGASSQTGDYLTPSSQFMGVYVSGQYLFHGIFLGYNVGAMATPKIDNAPTGSLFKYRTRDYTGDIGGTLGLVAVRYRTLCLIPSYGLSYGAWATHYQALPRPENGGGGEGTEGAIWTAHLIHDASMQLVYALPSGGRGGPRFAFGLRGGYRIYNSAAQAHDVMGPVQGSYAPIGMRGSYLQLTLGTGLIRGK